MADEVGKPDPKRRLKPERFAWLAGALVLAMALVLYLNNASASYASLVEEASTQETSTFEMAQKIQAAQSEIGSIDAVEETIRLCVFAIPALLGEIGNIEEELSVISLSTQSMWHNGWRGVNRSRLFAASDTFGELAKSRVAENGRLDCVSE